MINFFLFYLAKVVLILVHTASLMTWTQIAVCDLSEWRWSRDPQMILLDLGEVPQGIIRYRGGIWLVNTGNKGNYERKLRSALKYYGVSRVEGVFLTTVSESSNGGLISLLEDYPVKRLIRPQERSRSPLENQWDQHLGEREFERWNGACLSIGDSDFRVMGRGVEGGSDLKLTEDQGWVLSFEFRGRHLLWGNRISERRERELMVEKGIEVEVLVQGRNPRESHLSEDWLRYVNPRYLIVSASGRAIQKTGYDSAWNLSQRTKAQVIFLEKSGALILDWGDSISIRTWREPRAKYFPQKN